MLQNKFSKIKILKNQFYGPPKDQIEKWSSNLNSAKKIVKDFVDGNCQNSRANDFIKKLIFSKFVNNFSQNVFLGISSNGEFESETRVSIRPLVTEVRETVCLCLKKIG